VIVNLIAATTTKTGLQVKSRLDTRKYPKGVKVSKEEYMELFHLTQKRDTYFLTAA
jgi:hypothetical protein